MLQDLLQSEVSRKAHFAKMPRHLLMASLLAFAAAFIDPHYWIEATQEGEQKEPVEKKEEVQLPSEGVALYLVLDRSGSMEQELRVYTEKGEQLITRLDYLKVITNQFIAGNKQAGLKGREGDMLGLIAFSRTPQVLSPLTLDHDHLLKQLAAFKKVSSQNEDGTAIGYAILKTANLIAATRHYAEELRGEGRPAYEIKETAIILVTDGLQSVHPHDQAHALRSVPILRAAAYAK